MRGMLARELRLAWRQSADTAAALLFFVIAATLFPFALGPDPHVLSVIAPGIIWVCALLAALLPLERLFGADFEDGTLDLLLLSGLTAGGVAAVKTTAHWLTTGLPLLIIAAPLSVMLRMPAEQVPLLLLTLLPGTLLLSLLGTMAASITLGARRSAVLMPLITLPLMIPTLIFGCAAATAPHPQAALLMLAAMLVMALPLAPLAAGAALRAAAE
ncbi:MAG: heme exporter protein CcmB [Acidocella sp. 20-57-95]|nr:MAG: heme exporter protein CcmB [Acidocella sp. 20-57-95]OYV61146.1 MAG: heme exporter protein CcmB [Acidocella sp. 21-58-7]HQT64728.1 heme exporter protein CcmB [Acidocella sp.]HQU04806.1 heme exporter protein CcmB [Acidocella sp.]